MCAAAGALTRSRRCRPARMVHGVPHCSTYALLRVRRYLRPKAATYAPTSDIECRPYGYAALQC